MFGYARWVVTTVESMGLEVLVSVSVSATEISLDYSLRLERWSRSSGSLST